MISWKFHSKSGPGHGGSLYCSTSTYSTVIKFHFLGTSAKSQSKYYWISRLGRIVYDLSYKQPASDSWTGLVVTDKYKYPFWEYFGAHFHLQVRGVADLPIVFWVSPSYIATSMCLLTIKEVKKDFDKMTFTEFGYPWGLNLWSPFVFSVFTTAVFALLAVSAQLINCEK